MDISLIMKLAAAAAGVGLAAYGGRLYARAEESADWPSVNGRILAVRLHEVKGEDKSDVWTVEVEYEYDVGGVIFHGDMVGIGNERPTVSGRAALGVGDRFPLYGATPVYHHPADPARAVLEPGDTRPALSVIGGGVLLAIFSLLSLLF